MQRICGVQVSFWRYNIMRWFNGNDKFYRKDTILVMSHKYSNLKWKSKCFHC